MFLKLHTYWIGARVAIYNFSGSTYWPPKIFLTQFLYHWISEKDSKIWLQKDG